MSYRDWHVGMRVVFVGGGTHVRREPRFFGLFQRLVEFCRLTPGAEYTISEIGVGVDRVTGHAEVGIRISPDPCARQDGYYPAKLFRRVQPRATDISIFTAILNRAPAKEPA